MSLFGISLAGEPGEKLGGYLREAWGGAVIVPLLFVLYACGAGLFKFRIPKFRRQLFGTLLLYVSFAFLLGLLKESGWTSEAVLLMPGKFGSGLAKFFVLNAGNIITLVLIGGMFLLSAIFFGSKILRMNLPKMPTLKFRFRKKRRERESSRRDSDSPAEKSIPDPILRPSGQDYSDDFPGIPPADFDFRLPTLKPDPDTPPPAPEIDILPENVMSTAVEVIDNALALIDSGEMKAPPQKPASSGPRVKKLRRPLPPVNFPDDSDSSDDEKTLPPVPPKLSPKPSESPRHEEAPRRKDPMPETPPIPEEPPAPAKREEASFPPPPEIFGPKYKPEPDRDILKQSEKQAKIITSTLKTFSISASVAHIITGPTFIQYQIELAPGTKVNKIPGLAEELAMSLAVMSVRIEAPILGTRYVGIEVPRSDRKTIYLRSIIESSEYMSSSVRLPLPLGVNVEGRISVKGLEDMPHILVAGNAGSGRSMFVNASIMSMCSRRRPEELRLMLIDPRHVEFAVYDGLPHLIAPPVYDPDAAVKALTWAYDEMEKRTAAFASMRVRNLASFNRKQKGRRLPEIVIVINELADLVYASGPEIEGVIMRLAQKSGASGIYMMLAAQRPSPDVFTTMIKSNIPARAAFTLQAEADSKNIIGSSDAVRLSGKGDMLFRNTGSPQLLRYQAPYVGEANISDFTEYMFSSLEPPEMMKF